MSVISVATFKPFLYYTIKRGLELSTSNPILRIMDSINVEDLDSSFTDDLLPQEKHAPVMFLIDGSYSTYETGADKEIYAGLNNILMNIKNGDLGRLDPAQIDVAILRYGHDGVEELLPWTAGSQLKEIPYEQGNGATPMGKALYQAAGLAIGKLTGYRAQGIDAYCGAIFNITDGEPTDMDKNARSSSPQFELFASVKGYIESFEKAGSGKASYMQFIHLATKGANLTPLHDISPYGPSPSDIKKRRVFDLSDMKIEDVFHAVSVSLSNLDGIGPAEAIAGLLEAPDRG